MKPRKTPASKTKVVLTWIGLLVLIAAVYGFWTWWFARRPPTPDTESEPGIVFSIVMVVCGVLFLGAGIAGYAATILTNCLTFNFNKPVWSDLKVKLYFANIVVPLGVALGLGFFLSAVLSPALIAAGLNRGLANIGPVMGMVFVLQIAQLWILIWGPLEKRIIQRRTAALGITREQLEGAFLVGLSNPEKSSFKKLGLVEEDVGALWVGPDQLVYWGDGEQFGLTRAQIVEVERRTDSGSTSMLGGVAHVILHVRQPDGGLRQIRLHNEGLLTMGQKRLAMEQLAEAIEQWRGSGVPIATVVPM